MSVRHIFLFLMIFSFFIRNLRSRVDVVESHTVYAVAVTQDDDQNQFFLHVVWFPIHRKIRKI